MWANKFKREDWEDWQRLVKVFMIVMVVFGLAKTFNKEEVIKEAEKVEKAECIHSLIIIQAYLEYKDDASNTIENRRYLVERIQRGNGFISNENKDDFIKLANYLKENNEKEVGRLFNELLPKYVDEKNRDEFNELHKLAIDKKISQEEYDNKFNALVKKQISS